MSWLADLVPSAVADWLVTFAIHSTAILALALLASIALDRRWLAFQERMLRFSLWAGLVSSVLQMAFSTSPLPLALPTAAPAAASGDAAAVPVELATVADPIALLAAEVLPAADAGAALPPSFWLAVAAGGLALLGALWLMRAHARLRDVLRHRVPETDGRTLAIAAEAAGALGLRQSPHVSRCAGIVTPIAFGCLRPEICLPQRAHSLDDDQLRAMLAHEIAHLRRFDPVWMWLAAGIHALFPWQVLLLAVRRRWGQLVELRCDAIAADQTSPTTVARCLLDVAEWLKPDPARAVAPTIALGMAARPSALRRRVETALHRGAAGRLPRGLSLCFGSVSLSALTFVAPGVRTGEDLAELPPEPAVVESAPSPGATPGAIELQSTLALLRGEYAMLEQELERLRARAANHPKGPAVSPLINEITLRLGVVRSSCEQVESLIDRRLSEISVPSSR
ncbi:MAG: M56 family metallopeptidase [Planctomycetes bacterium]|nr:M56 family metallopeptidase [Planctomycetota bacterium]